MMVSIEYGGKMTADGYEGCQFMLREKGLYQNEQVEVTGNGSHFTIQRLYDVFHNGGAFEKVFNVHFRPA